LNTEIAKVGDTVVCINVDRIDGQLANLIELYKEYTVGSVNFFEGETRYRFEELPVRSGSVGYRAQRFELATNPNY
jgi:hypothetical protein